jgi:hypothetical protein
MRKLIGLIVAVLALGIFAAPVAQSHGLLCFAQAYKPTHPNGTMNYSGEYACDVSHDTITLTLTLQRRQVGGSWVTVATAFDTEGPTTRNFSAWLSSIAFDCRKDYRTHTIGDAQPGNHHNTANSDILLHTC